MLNRSIRLILAICFVVVLPMTMVNILLTHVFVTVEYSMPWFVSDPYGFTDAQRFQYAIESVDALKSKSAAADLAEIGTADGRPIYIQREIDHMVDVKNVIDRLNGYYMIALSIFILGAVILLVSKDISGLLSSIRLGSLLIILTLLGLGGFASISFWDFFAWFHSLFFNGDSWLFHIDDALIRLFPIRFWEDAVGLLLGGTLLIAIGLYFGLKPSKGGGVSTK